jgi:hypothetical protein
MFYQRAVARSLFILACLGAPSSLRADDPLDIGAALDRAIAAYESGNRVESLQEITLAQAALRAELAEIRLAYRERDRSITDRFIRIDFDLDGRVDQLGGIEIDYDPFSDRISAIGDTRVTRLQGRISQFS